MTKLSRDTVALSSGTYFSSENLENFPTLCHTGIDIKHVGKRYIFKKLDFVLLAFLYNNNFFKFKQLKKIFYAV